MRKLMEYVKDEVRNKLDAQHVTTEKRIGEIMDQRTMMAVDVGGDENPTR